MKNLGLLYIISFTLAFFVNVIEGCDVNQQFPQQPPPIEYPVINKIEINGNLADYSINSGDVLHTDGNENFYFTAPIGKFNVGDTIEIVIKRQRIDTTNTIR